MLRSPRSRALALMVLFGALVGLCVWYGSLGPDPAAWALPGEEELATDYDRYVGERVAVGGTVASVEPVVIVAGYGVDGELRLAVDGVPTDSVAVGDSLRVYGVARADGSIGALNAVAVPRWGYWYMYPASFLAGLWVLGRIVRHWRLEEWGLVPRARPLRAWDRVRSLVGREAEDA